MYAGFLTLGVHAGAVHEVGAQEPVLVAVYPVIMLVHLPACSYAALMVTPAISTPQNVDSTYTIHTFYHLTPLVCHKV